MATEQSHSNWWTPRDLVKVLMKEFNFDLDAAADAESAICPRFITAEQDALVVPWDGTTVWCNPPFGVGYRNTIAPFVQRAYEQHLEQRNIVVMLLPAYVDPLYWRTYCMKAHEIRFLAGRLAFLEGGKSKMSARFPSALVVFKHISGLHYGKGVNQWVWDWRVS